ncbi:MAG: hypothetical protein OEL79_11335 [Chromatiales bacterium]|nr:hypothetical protein [Chromatiales bacterium]
MQLIATAVMARKEELIKAAITHAIGDEDWDLDEMRTRGEFRVNPNGSEIFVFDDVDMIQFNVVEPEITASQVHTVLKMTQPFKLLYT